MKEALAKRWKELRDRLQPLAKLPAIRRLRTIGRLLLRTIREFLRDRPFVLAAALSYYSLLSVAPLALLVTAIAGLVYGEAAAQGEIVERMGDLVSPEVAELVESMLARAYDSGATWLSTIVSVVGLLVGATTAFAQLQAALNQIWGVFPPPRPLQSALRARILSFAFVLLLGTSVVALLVASSVISALRSDRFFGQLGFTWRLIDLGIPLVLMTGLFAALFRWLPDARVRWRDVWIGGVITSALFILGRLGIGLYIGRTGVGSTYGAAGSLVALMVWTFYSALIVLFGAQFTQIFASDHGGGVEPIRGATLRPQLPPGGGDPATVGDPWDAQGARFAHGAQNAQIPHGIDALDVLDALDLLADPEGSSEPPPTVSAG